MSEPREKLFFHWSDSSQKFDYYVTGLVAAVVVYLTKEYRASPLGINPATIDLAAIVALAVSLMAGLTQIERAVTILRVTHDLLPKEEWLRVLRSRPKGQRIARESTPDVDMSESEITEELEKIGRVVGEAKRGRERLRSTCMFCNTVRNVGLLLGIVLMIAAKIAVPYIEKSNQSLLSTTTAVTHPADAPVAPPSGAAGL